MDLKEIIQKEKTVTKEVEKRIEKEVEEAKYYEKLEAN